MNKQVLLSLLRTVLTAFGAFLIGKNIFGNPVDDVLWQSIVGGILAAISIVWGFVDKSNTLDALQSGLRSIIVVFGGLLVASGKITDKVLESISGIVAAVIPFLYSILSKQKTDQIAEGKLKAVTDGAGVTTLKKVA